MSYKDLPSKIKSLKPCKIVLVGHRYADADALVSIELFKFLVNSIRKDIQIDILIPEKISGKAIKISKNLKIKKLEVLPEPEIYNLAVFLDVGGESVLGSADIYLKNVKEKWLIDHHIQTKKFTELFDYVIVDNQSASSACEIIYNAINHEKISLPKKLKLPFLSALLAETRFLRIAKKETLYIISKLCENENLIQEASELLKYDLDQSGKIAILKSLKRCEVYQFRNYLISFSRVGSHHSQSAKMLSNIGIDFVVVGDDNVGKCNLHIIMSKRITNFLKIDAGGDIVKLMTNKFGGTGGGHPGIAVLEIYTTLNNAYKYLHEIIKNNIHGLNKELTKIE